MDETKNGFGPEESRTEQQAPAANSAPAAAADDGQVCAVLAYLLIGIIWYFADEKQQKNDLAKFHVKQAIVLFVLSLACSVVLTATLIGIFLTPFVGLASTVLAVIGLINAANRQKKALPFIGGLSSYLKF